MPGGRECYFFTSFACGQSIGVLSISALFQIVEHFRVFTSVLVGLRKLADREGKRKTMMLLGLTPILSAAAVAASSIGSGSCMQDCTIEPGQDGKQIVVCGCGKSPAAVRLWSKGAANLENRATIYNFVKSRLVSFSEKEWKAVAENSCRKEFESGARHSSDRLCNCVLKNVRLEMHKSCFRTIAGETVCVIQKRGTPAERPLRSPTILDYQYCFSEFSNDRPPASCKDAVCDLIKPTCKSGEELYNDAVEGACCPVFVCRKI